MSNTKTIMGQASNQYVAPTDITDVFSTYLYDGVSSALTINNGIDLTKGGLVWTKRRNISRGHVLFDSERGASSRLVTSSNVEAQNQSYSITYNSNGYSWSGADNDTTIAGSTYASWTFRKAPKFFDVVTWTGTGGTGSRTIAHNLGTTVGMLLVKRTSDAEDWTGYHRGVNGGVTPQNYKILINSTAAAASSAHWASTAPTTTAFTVSQYHNVSGATYVAYLFAHNNSDGTFGPDGDQDIIKCGSFTGSSATVTLGFEPQFLLFKNTVTASDWIICDNMRGLSVGDPAKELYPNNSNAESNGGNFGHVTLSPTGFSVGSGYTGNYIYMAIRRGPLAPPTAGTEVFAVDTGTGASDKPRYISNFPVDMAIITSITASEDNYNGSRLSQERYLVTNTSAAESGSINFSLDYNDGWFGAGGTNRVSWMWKRAPSFFDVVAYTGTGVAGRTVSHNLTVAPEMMWVKRRNTSQDWAVFHKDEGATKTGRLDGTAAFFTATSMWNDVAPTSTEFTVGTSGFTNGSTDTYIAYLFESLDGVSKVGSYTGDGTTDGSKVIDCGFTSGARFILIKRSSGTGNWWVWDSVRGIAAGNDPVLGLNLTTGETQYDWLDPDSSGFKVINVNTNNSGDNYIFYAIA
jgi:hypothetical protein